MENITDSASRNSSLQEAKKRKNDEFYTQLIDIENEVSGYKDYLNDKVVYCNCDDPAWSNFVRYFIIQFKNFKLKRLIATGYTAGNGALTNQLDLVDLMQMEDDRNRDWENGPKKSYYIDIRSVSDKLVECFRKNANNDLSNYDLLKMLKKEKLIQEFKGDGDFRSEECIKLLKESDVVITNPPFSLFREYIGQLFKYNKKFLIMGNINAVTYKEVFKHIKNKELWLGYNNNKTVEFELSPFYEKYSRIENGRKFSKIQNISWFTNLEISKTNKLTDLHKKYYTCEADKYNPDYSNPEYPKYDNYDAIEVSKLADIPTDYYGVMGVPITFLDKYSSGNFEIVKFRKGDDDRDLTYTKQECLRRGTDVEGENRSCGGGGVLQNNSTVFQNTRSTLLELMRMRKEIQSRENECLLMVKKNTPEYLLGGFDIVALGVVGSCTFTCNKKMEVLDRDGNGTGKYTMNAKGTLYRKYNPEVDKRPAFRDVLTNELYTSIYARVLVKRIKK